MKLKRLLVVGAGIGGSMVAREAAAAGWKVTVTASATHQPASRAALCVVNPAWWTGSTREMAWHALDVYAELKALTANTAHYTRYDTALLDPQRPGFYAVDPAKVLVEPDSDRPWHPDDQPNGFDRVVVCMGAYSSTRGQRNWGVTTVITGEAQPGLRAHLAARRKLLFAVSHDGATTRFGSSVAPDEVTAHERQVYAERRNKPLVPAGPREHISGVRLMPAGSPGLIRQLDRHVWSLDSFGRVGFSLAPSRAQLVVERL